MGAQIEITPPAGENDTEGAQRVFDEFLVMYQPTLTILEYHLEGVIENTEGQYADAYRPWQQALHDLCRGVYLVTRKIPLPDVEEFMDAVRMFSFESAIQFLCDLCVTCKINLRHDWADNFRKHIDLLLFSMAILNRNVKAQPELAR